LCKVDCFSGNQIKHTQDKGTDLLFDSMVTATVETHQALLQLMIYKLENQFSEGA
jgi:hypothetical protein